MNEEMRYQVVIGSQSAHCCFDATVVDSSKPTGYREKFEQVCECFDVADAELICAALNAYNQTPNVTSSSGA